MWWIFYLHHEYDEWTCSYPRSFLILSVSIIMLDGVHMPIQCSQIFQLIDDVITSVVLLLSAQIFVPGRGWLLPRNPWLEFEVGLSNSFWAKMGIGIQ